MDRTVCLRVSHRSVAVAGPVLVVEVRSEQQADQVAAAAAEGQEEPGHQAKVSLVVPIGEQVAGHSKQVRQVEMVRK